MTHLPDSLSIQLTHDLPETGSFVLNFNGRVTLASVKNFQVVHDNDCKINPEAVVCCGSWFG